LKRLTQNKFLQGDSTIGVEFQSFLLRVEDRLCKLHIWDTAGQENFRSVTKVFYRQTHAVLLCFPINSRDAFNNLQYWLNEINA
jgi:small GTP-binding protein